MRHTGLASSHEEADHILVQQYQGGKVRVICEDTYVLVHLPNLYVYHTCTRALQMGSQWEILDCGSGVEVTVQKNKDKAKAILVMLALTGAESVTATCNVGKQVARKAMEQPIQTMCPSLVTPQADLDHVCSSAMWTRICIV